MILGVKILNLSFDKQTFAWKVIIKETLNVFQVVMG